MKEIYLAGGCFWGVEKYLSSIYGVTQTKAGYANGITENPSYEDVCHRNTGHAETVKVIYDSTLISLPFLLKLFYEIIDPVAVNRQGYDTGIQYRTGVYYIDNEDRKIIEQSINELQNEVNGLIAVEVLPLENFYEAEEYHQKYLDKNPLGYCHISKGKIKEVKLRKEQPSFAMKFDKRSEKWLKENLNSMQYKVTQQEATEPPFKNEYYNHFEKGIYVDITTGEPLFLSDDKFDSGCGWPSFSKPIDEALLKELTDSRYGMVRTEVRSVKGDSHLGHVFPDGPKERGGLRYCINSAALRFIPKDRMEAEGYGYLVDLL